MAAITWTEGVDGVTGACSSGASMDAPTVATDGLSLYSTAYGGLKALQVAYAATSGNLTLGGKLIAYLWIPLSAAANKWHRAYDLDLTIGEAAGTAAWMGFTVPGAGIPGSRIAYAPSGVGQAGSLLIMGSK